jgi:hypothetical protein
MYSDSPKAKRIEFRCPDASANPYLAFAAMLMAGLDGVQNKIHPGDPIDKNLYDLPPEVAAKVPHPCASLDEPPVVPNHHRMVCCDRKFASKRGPDGDEGLGLTLE